MKYLHTYNEISGKQLKDMFSRTPAYLSQTKVNYMDKNVNTDIFEKTKFLLGKYINFNKYRYYKIEDYSNGDLEVTFGLYTFHPSNEQKNTSFEEFIKYLQKFKIIIDKTKINYHLDLETNAELTIIFEYNEDKYTQFIKNFSHIIEGEKLGLF